MAKTLIVRFKDEEAAIVDKYFGPGGKGELLKKEPWVKKLILDRIQEDTEADKYKNF